MKKYFEPEFNMSSVNFSTDTCDDISGDVNSDVSSGNALPIVPASE